MSKPTALEIVQKVKKAWLSIEAPPHEDMGYFIEGWGDDEKYIFLDVRPVDVDRKDPNFLVADVLAEMSPRATAAYLGPYLMAFFEDLAFQEDEDFFSEPMVYRSLLSLLTRPRTWPNIGPYLPRECKEALGDAVHYMLKSRKILKPDGSLIVSLEKLAHSITSDTAREL